MAGRIAGITIEIGGNTTKLQTALKGVDSSIKKTQSSLRDVDRLLKFNPASTQLLTQKQQLLKKSIDDTRDRLKQLKDAQTQMDAKGVDKNSEEYQRLQREITATENKLKSLEKQYSQVASVAGTKLQAMGDKMKELGAKIANAGQAVTQKLTAPIVALGAASVKAFADVDKGMDSIVSKTGATGQALEDMKNTAKDLATSIPTDFQTAGDAVGQVSTRFKLTGEELSNVSGQFIKFAKLNNTDVKTSVNSVQSAMAAFGVQTKDTGAFLDTLNNVTQTTGADVNRLASEMTTNAASLKEMGYSASDAANFLGQLSVNGVDSSQVMAGLKKAFAQAAKEGKPLKQKLSELQDTMKNADTDTEAYAAALEVFGNRAGPALAAAIRDGRLSLDQLGTSLNDAVGNIETTFENTLDPVDKFKMAINQAKVAGADLGGALLTTITPMIEKLQTSLKSLGERFKALTPQQQEMIVKIGLIAASIGPALVVIGKLSVGLGAVTKAVGTAINGISALIAGTAGIAAPVIAAVAAIGGLVAAGYAIRKSSDAAIEAQNDFTKEQRESLDAVNQLTEAYKQADDAAKQKNETISAEFTHVRDLKEEYNGLVDSNGQIAESDKARAQVIIGELAQALGMEKSQIQELIGANGQLSGSIDEVITKKEAQAYLDANYDAYVDALKLQTSSTNDLAGALQALTDKENQAASAKQKLSDAQKLLSDAQEMGSRNTASLQTKVDNAQRSYEAAKSKVDEAKKSVKEYSDASADASQKIANYQKLQESVQTGSLDKISDAMSTYQNNLKTATTATKEELDQQAKDARDAYDAIKAAYERGDVTKATVDAAKKRMDAAAKEASSVTKSAQTENTGVSTNASQAAQNATRSSETAKTNVTRNYQNMSNSVAGMFPRNLGTLFTGALTTIKATITDAGNTKRLDYHTGVQRFAKGYSNPLLFTSPTLVGNSLFGDRGGTNGGEMVYSRSRLLSDIRDAIGGVGGNTFNITVDGTTNPEEFADRLINQIQLRSRTI